MNTYTQKENTCPTCGYIVISRWKNYETPYYYSTDIEIYCPRCNQLMKIEGRFLE